MSFETLLSNLVYPAVIAIAVGLWKLTTRLWTVSDNMDVLKQRLEKVENRVAQQVTEIELRQILSDKLDPLKEDLHELRKQNEKITDILLKKN